MRPVHWTAALLLSLAFALPAPTDGRTTEDRFVPMFDGTTLKGWVNVNCARGTFYVKDNEIITTGRSQPRTRQAV